jgi:hypothetical protein
MTKTAQEVTTQALQNINVVGVGDTPSSEDAQKALDHLEAIFDTLDVTEGMALDWTIETVPNRLFLPLADMVSGSIALSYEKPQFTPLYGRGLKGIRRAEFGNEPVDTVRSEFF